MKVVIQNYDEKFAGNLAKIYYHTIHMVNAKDYTKEQLDAWAPSSSLEVDTWKKKFAKTKPLIALIENEVAGFAEFEKTGYIDCFYVHHSYIGKGVGKTLMLEIFARARKENTARIFADVSITARPFFEKVGFRAVKEQLVELRGTSLKNYKMEKLF